MSKPLLAAVLICLLGAGAQAQTQPIPQGREPGTAPYDPFAQGRAAPAAAPDAEPATPGFRITVPMCRRAEQADDPLAWTAECATLLKAAEDQARACRQAFEKGDDKAAMSDACRQAAGFR
ncbi:MAG TPA: hypothetical protein VGM25_03515 [Caulobacteraceae bacterium]|jgi:hypothetical protein